MTNVVWFDRHVSKIKDKRSRAKIKALTIQPPPEVFGVEWCQQTPSAFELRVMSAVRRAIGRECDRLGVSRPVPANGLVHIVHGEVFEAVIGPNLAGRAHFRRVYLMGSLPEDRFINIVSHEFSHSVSYLAVESVPPPSKFDLRDPLATKSWFRHRRAGLELTAYRCSGRQYRFTAINEAATEIMAHRAEKWLLDDHDPGLVRSQRRKAARHWNYQAAVWLVNALIGKLGPVFGGTEAARDQLLRDYLTGSMVFLRELNRRIPGAVSVLATVSPQRLDAAGAAKILGLERAYAKIISLDDGY